MLSLSPKNHKPKSIIFLAMCFLFALGSQAETIALSGIIRCPYVCSQEENKKGYIIDFAEAIFSQNNHTLTFMELPWSRALSNAKRGDLDGLAGVYFRNVPSFIIPKKEQGFSELHFFVERDSTWNFEGFNSLQKISIGVTRDVSYGPIDSYIDRYKNDKRYINTVSGTSTLSRTVKMILSKRTTATLEDLHVMRYHLHSNNQTTSLKAAGSLSGDNLYIAFPPSNNKSLELSTMIAEGMERLRSTGELSKIMSKYGLTDWRFHPE